MPKRKGNFNAWRLEKLADPVNAANYLSAALEDSPDIFLDAVKDVIQATSVSKIAQKANLTRESIYRSFSATGNPTLETLTSVLDALGLKLSKIAPRCGSLTSSSPLSGSATRRHNGRSKYGRRGLRDRSQLLLSVRPPCRTHKGVHHFSCSTSRPLADRVLEAAIGWADATVSTQYDAENKFWNALSKYRETLLP
jgi:probable addiction module antidote protein